MTPFERAKERIDNTPILEEYRDICLRYDWTEGDHHYNWIASAPAEDILNWAEDVAFDSEEEPDDEELWTEVDSIYDKRKDR